MNKSTVVELENFIFDAMKEPAIAADITANIIGVLIGLKPAMIGDFEKSKFVSLDFERLEELLDKLSLKRVYFDQCYLSNNKKVEIKDFCISKKMRTAEQLRKVFVELWSTMNDEGEVLNKKKWKKATKKIGKMLGYPKTAINSFVKENDVMNEERMKRMRRNRYYAHSAKYEEREFRTYDQKLNRAIAELAPKTAEFFSSNKKKRWLD